MVLYFSATGNSEFVARYISEKTDDKLICLNDYLREDEECSFRSETPFIFVAPIYAWRFPMIIEKLIREAKLSGNRRIYFIGTMESQCGDCGKYLKLIADKKKMEFMGFEAVAMPSNYIIGGELPSSDDAIEIIKKSVPKLDKICENINAGLGIAFDKGQLLGSVCSGLINDAFNKIFISSKAYSVSDDCVSCGHCIDICPVHNIFFDDGKPVFYNDCIGCYACINRCPSEAINIGSRTVGRRRYVCPDYDKIMSQL